PLSLHDALPIYLVRHGQESLVRALAAFDLWLVAESAFPFVAAGGCIATAPGLAIVPAQWEDILATGEQPAEQRDLLICRRCRGHRSVGEQGDRISFSVLGRLLRRDGVQRCDHRCPLVIQRLE